ncbi:MAG: SDR family NAD(P)-dependent oxidoreductase [Dehalococcoidia bacterium]|nr:SDR family NAD(P)-dependent oxidoreductase [Dehalococcoidia bacterium]
MDAKDSGRTGGGARQMGDGSFLHAFFAARRDLKAPKVAEVDPAPHDARIDGKTCLITGANSGLGKAAAVELARRGGTMILACRPGHDGTRDEVARLSGSEAVEMLEVDLADLASVHRLCDRLAERGTRVDIAVFNAGLMPRTAQKTPQGYETMFAVHFLSSRVMLDRWLEDGVLRPASPGAEAPRVIFVSSEAHRSGHTIDFGRLGDFVDYDMGESMVRYGLTKLVQCTFAKELSRRLNPADGVEVAVHAMCPGGVASNIARDTPLLLKPLANAVLGHFFQSPEEAIGPVIYLCCADEPGQTTGMYLHLMQRKAVSPTALDPENGARLWEASEPLVAQSRESRRGG